jgi:probable F420-dependent oxidoreductase
MTETPGGRARASDGVVLTAGVHMPQAGPAASPGTLAKAARHAEQLGFAGIWFSDHLTVRRGTDYPPSAYIYEALVAMTWAAAATSTVEIGTSVLVLPMRRPTVLAKSLASLDLLSGGRLIAGVAGGYVEPEFATLGVPFAERGPRTDEAIRILRTMWTQDPISAAFPVHGLTFADMRAKPQPDRIIPVWVGGQSAPALRRAVTVGDGWHGAVRPDTAGSDLPSLVRLLRESRPATDFVLSVRAFWDGLDDDHATLHRSIDHLRELGITHIVAEPRQRTEADYLRSIDRLAEIFGRAGVAMAP